MTQRHLVFILGLAACALLAAVFVPPLLPTPNPQPIVWTLADVRAFDPADAAQPTHDLLAVYVRPAPGELYLRLDLLDHALLPDYDLYLALNTTPDGATVLPIDARASLTWDLLLAIPAYGKMAVLGPDLQPVPGASLAVFRDSTLDTLTLRLAGQAAPKGMPQAQVFVTPAGSPQVADASQPSDATAATLRPARALLAFTDAFPAYTPATALRRWNGAHTGPLGGSHGLALLLRVAHSYGIPLALTDLRHPASLAALEPVDGLPLVREMAAAGLLILPEPLLELPVQPDLVARWQAETRRVAAGFSLPPQALAYASSPALAEFADAPIVLTGRFVPAAASEPPLLGLVRRGSRKLLPLTTYDPQQATTNGPALPVRRAMAAAAVAGNSVGASGDGGPVAPGAPIPAAGQDAILVLGGSLPDSTWGAGLPAERTLHYLRSRPWVHFLNAAELAALPAASAAAGNVAAIGDGGPAAPGSTIPASGNAGSPFHPSLSEGEHAALLAALQAAPDNALTAAAWQAYWSLYAPVYPASERLPALRASYSGTVWSLLAAAAWAAAPMDLASCTTDPDRDGQAECVLSNRFWYAQFEADHGAVTHFFQLDEAGAHQWIAPSAQLITGLSESAGWKPGSGPLADPQVIPGSFFEPGIIYQNQVAAGRIIFTGLGGRPVKTFTLTRDRITVEYQTTGEFPFSSVQVNLAPDPWKQFAGDWSRMYRWLRSDAKIAIAPPGSVPYLLELSSSAPLTASAFSDTLQFLPRAENPDREIPPGHFLPFPFYQIEVSTQAQTQVIIELVGLMYSSPNATP